MLVALGINLVNVAVAFVLIFGYLGFPALGVAGSAWGAAAGRTAGSLALLLILISGTRKVDLRLGGRDGWLPDSALIRRLARIGLPSMGEQLSRSLGMLPVQHHRHRPGHRRVRAQRITFNILSSPSCPASASPWRPRP